MLKACTLFRRKPGLSDEEYQSYWRTGHVPFVTALRGVHRYVQSHPLAGANRSLVYDGVVELWVDDVEALKSIAQSKEYAAVVEDEKVFADRASINLVLTEEHVVLDGKPAADSVKQIIFLKRKPGMIPVDFQRYWREQHAPLVGQPPGLQRYVQSHAKLAGYKDGREPAWDGIGIMWFDSLEGMQRARKAPGQDEVREDAANFADVSRLASLVAKEYVMRG